MFAGIIASVVSSIESSIARSTSVGGLSLFLWLLALSPAAALEMRVAIEDGTSEVKVGSSTPATVKDGSGRVLGQLDGMNAFLAVSGNNQIALSTWQAGQMWIEPGQGGFVYIGDRWYRGRTKLVLADGGLTAVNYVDLEEYLYSVVGAEMSPSWPSEALKAQAVAARSYALYQRKHRGTDTYDVGDDTFWQVYVGTDKEDPNTIAAVNATRGEILTYDAQVIEAVFHASSGGHTEDVEQIWQEPKPYLRGVPDYDGDAPVYQWNETFSSGELSNRISGVGTVDEMLPDLTTPHGRVISMTVIGSGGTRSIEGEDVRRALNLRSTLFTVTPQGDSFNISGRGFGHGVGLSQWGAKGMAAQGYNYRQILGHYYPNTSLLGLSQ
ncbi:SpoIID/LytB domain-containing protein [Oscillatoriales cyanobacterium LEGE 11467]|uniref:SpoIID/LytB domain-containing protein n=1 Tax=Zarconia navalis LEGE 11467 TaxID=1828826 RepID=A0A928VXV1_9CYAN|nr:SpoIID/LytB domain-containing protein [Zarconia navalis LEGE 11467]